MVQRPLHDGTTPTGRPGISARPGTRIRRWARIRSRQAAGIWPRCRLEAGYEARIPARQGPRAWYGPRARPRYGTGIRRRRGSTAGIRRRHPKPRAGAPAVSPEDSSGNQGKSTGAFQAITGDKSCIVELPASLLAAVRTITTPPASCLSAGYANFQTAAVNGQMQRENGLKYHTW